MDTVSYPAPAVIEYVERHLVPFSASMGQREHWPLFRDHQVIWTPSIGCGDRKGTLHWVSPGFLPPTELLAALRIGRARCLMAWTRHVEAAAELEAAAASGGAMVPEAMFWLATAYFFEHRSSSRMYEVWAELRRRYPDNPWAHRTYPHGSEA